MKNTYIPCPYCERKFATERSRDIHLIKYHYKEKEVAEQIKRNKERKIK